MTNPLDSRSEQQPQRDSEAAEFGAAETSPSSEQAAVPAPTASETVPSLEDDISSSAATPETQSTSAQSSGFAPLGWVSRAWESTSSRLKTLLPANPISRWFQVSEAEMAEILATVRQKLPTTEALLIGKPQAGKSSIVRGLTGVSEEIVGQGFRPHTQHTERYAYPSDDLPLLVFTDTVGLGDVNQDTQTIVDELVGDLRHTTERARIFILTVKVHDFAVDGLLRVIQSLRQQYPRIPCLLAITCLHEIYPPETDNHPEYPPDYEAIERSSASLQESFGNSVDRTVVIDFTLEEDGYTPVFYGLDAFRDALADLLPEAEARAIYTLLSEQEAASQQLGSLYRDVGRRYILAFSTIAATLAAVPLPFATMPVLTALQASMVGVLGSLYGQKVSPSQAGGLVSAIAGGFLAQAVGRELIKFIPGFGSVIAASWAAAYTWALGETACVYFGDLMGGKKPDPERIQAVMRESFAEARERFKRSDNSFQPEDSAATTDSTAKPSSTGDRSGL